VAFGVAFSLGLGAIVGHGGVFLRFRRSSLCAEEKRPAFGRVDFVGRLRRPRDKVLRRVE
jgi:hypothetical protein